MNLRSLPLGQMIALSGLIIAKKKETFLSIDEIRGLFAALQAVHEQALAVQNSSRASRILRELSEKLRLVDMRHDRLISIIWNAIGVQITFFLTRLSPNIARVAQLEALRSKILPDGCAWAQRAYLEEAGNARHSVSLLNEGDKALLKRIPVDEVHLLDIVHEWGMAAEELAELENERSMIKDLPTDLPSEYKVRMRWIRIVNSILDVLEVSSASPAQIEALRGPIEDAVAAQEKRDAARAARSETAGEADSDEADVEDAGETETEGTAGPAETEVPAGPAETKGPAGPAETKGPAGPAETKAHAGPAETEAHAGPAETEGPAGPETGTTAGTHAGAETGKPAGKPGLKPDSRPGAAGQ